MTQAMRFVLDAPRDCSGGLSVPLDPECGCLERSLKKPSSSLLELGDMTVTNGEKKAVRFPSRRRQLSARNEAR